MPHPEPHSRKPAARRWWASFLPALMSAACLALVGVVGMAGGMAWLFPSLGPTIAIQSASPDLPMSRPWNVVMGHLLGLGAGFLAVYATGAWASPPSTSAGLLTGARVAAAVLAVFLSMALQALMRARHAPAEATTLLVALGAFPPTQRSALTIIAGVALIAILGEAVRNSALSARRRQADTGDSQDS